MNIIKMLLLKLYLWYDNKVPLQRGKFFLSKLVTAITDEINIKTHDGFWLRVIPSSAMDRSYLGYQNRSHDIISDEIQKLQKGDVFVDIGSNIGYYTFKAASVIGHEGLVYSFEPSKREYRRLLRGIELNKLNNILSFHCALSDQNGIIKFQVDQYHTGLNRLGDVNNPEISSFVVPVFRADYIIAQKKIALLKIDVEGAEYKVLLGLHGLLEKRFITKLIIEITPDFLKKFNNSKDELYSLMYEYQYISLVNSDEWQYDEIFVLDEHI